MAIDKKFRDADKKYAAKKEEKAVVPEQSLD
jgi:hypothetical protein